MPFSKALNLLVVEDNLGDFLLIKDYLKTEILHPNIYHAETFAQAKEILSQSLHIDAILLDLTLPDAGGIGLVTEIINLANSTPVIVFTGHTDRDFGIKTLSLGISDYLLKDEITASHLYKSIAYSIERKRVAIELNESEKKYRQLFRLSPTPMWVFDVETLSFLGVNNAAIKHYGYSKEEFLSMTIKDIRPAEDVEKLEDRVRINKDVNIAYNEPFRHLKKNGELILVDIQSNTISFNGRKAKLVLATDITERRKKEQEITRAIINAQEQERHQIGIELHDNVNQILVGALLALGITKESTASEDSVWIDKSYNCVSTAIDEIRRLSHRLAPASYDEISLEDSFKNLLNSINFDQKYQISLYFEDFDKDVINNDIQLNLYRILQEQLKNIVKYSDAISIEVGLIMNKEKIRMHIIDDGKGFDLEIVKKGIGIRNIKKRTELFFGFFTLNSSVGNGCEIIIEIPLKENNIRGYSD